MRGPTGRRRKLPDLVLGAHTPGACAAGRQAHVHHNVRHHAGVGQLCRAGHGGPGGPETAVDRVRGRPGRDHVHLWLVLLLGRVRARSGGRRPVAAVRVPLCVLHRVLGGRRVYPGGVAGRDVPGEHPLALFRHRVHYARVLLVRLQQDVPVRVRQVRHARHVLVLRGRQSGVRVLRSLLRDRDERQNVPGDPETAGEQRAGERCRRRRYREDGAARKTGRRLKETGRKRCGPINETRAVGRVRKNRYTYALQHCVL